jgi:nucleoside-diphosphate-sugar epimerase
MDLSLYGATGIIGTYYRGLFPSKTIDKNQLDPESNEVLYLISTTSNQNIKTDPFLDIDTNLIVLAQRLKACKEAGVTVFNFVSSWFVYGPHHRYPNENSLCDPNGLYSATKHCAEKFIREYCNEFGIKWRILRLGNVYGGPDKGSLKRNSLHFLIEKLKKDEDITIYSGLSRDFIHILDVCRGINFVLKKGNYNEIYNIGTGVGTELHKCIQTAKYFLQSDSKISTVKIPLDYPQAKKISLDCRKIESLRFKPLINITEGIEDLCLSRRLCTPDRTLMEKKLKQPSPPFEKDVGTQQEQK